MKAPASQVRIRQLSLDPSPRARVTTRIIRWLCRKPPTDLSEQHDLVRLRKRIAVFDRLTGLFGLGRAAPVLWHRACVNSVRVRVVRSRQEHAATGSDTAPVLLYLHGGAFLVRALNRHMDLADRICRAAGLQEGILPIYRLAPEHPFPAAIDDCLAVYRGLLRHKQAHRIVLAGDSAGGGLVLKLLMRIRDLGLPMPACGVLLSPFTDLSCSGDSISANAPVDPMFGNIPSMHARFYLGALGARDPRCSPLFGDFAGLPPLLAQVGSTERLLDDSLRLAPRVRRAGGALEVEIWQDLPHVWHLMGMPESDAAISSVARFMREHLRRTRPAHAQEQRRAA